jgi:hypothetical protein
LPSLPEPQDPSATFLVCLSCSSRRIARELAVHIRTSYRWCWICTMLLYPTRDAAPIGGHHRSVGTLSHSRHQGPDETGGKKRLGRWPYCRRKKRKPSRGHYDKGKPTLIAWLSQQEPIVVQAVRAVFCYPLSQRGSPPVSGVSLVPCTSLYYYAIWALSGGCAIHLPTNRHPYWGRRISAI